MMLNVQTLKKDWVVNGVRGHWQIRKNQSSQIATVDSLQNVWQHSQDCSFSQMTWPKSQLQWQKKVGGCQVLHQLICNKMFKKLWQFWHISLPIRMATALASSTLPDRIKQFFMAELSFDGWGNILAVVLLHTPRYNQSDMPWCTMVKVDGR